jgi:hypothetical protein
MTSYVARRVRGNRLVPKLGWSVTERNKRFDHEERWARAAAVTWLRHPKVRDAVSQAKPLAERIVAPLEPRLPDQIAVTRFCNRVFSLGVVTPDGTIDANPFDQLDMLDTAERAEAEAVMRLFGTLVVNLVAGLAAAGVQIDPDHATDRAAFGCLLLLEVDWSAHPETIAANLQPGGLSLITVDRRAVTARDGRNQQLATNADAIRRELRAEAGGRNLQVAYAGGRKRRPPNVKATRQQALSELWGNPRFTGTTVSSVPREWNGAKPDRAGVWLKKRWTELLGREPDKPSDSTLRRDLTDRGLPPTSPGK